MAMAVLVGAQPLRRAAIFTRMCFFCPPRAYPMGSMAKGLCRFYKPAGYFMAMAPLQFPRLPAPVQFTTTLLLVKLRT